MTEASASGEYTRNRSVVPRAVNRAMMASGSPTSKLTGTAYEPGSRSTPREARRSEKEESFMAANPGSWVSCCRRQGKASYAGDGARQRQQQQHSETRTR